MTKAKNKSSVVSTTNATVNAVNVTEQPSPNIGQMVFYMTKSTGQYPTRAVPAIVTEVIDDDAILFVFSRNDTRFVRAKYSKDNAPGHWALSY